MAAATRRGVIGQALDGSTTRNRSVCEMGVYLAQLEPDDRAALEDAFLRPIHELGHKALYDSLSAMTVVAAYGPPPPVFTIGSHRRGNCRCPRPDAAA